MRTADRQRPTPGSLHIDHVSHFVADLDAAAAAFEALGFRVTPASAQHTPEGPVGASNRCVMLEDGYIELLAPTHDTPAAQRIRALMGRYPGVHLVCFGTADAAEEHRRLEAHGFAPQPLVDLQRETPAGAVKFKVARPSPEKMPEGRIQFVEQVTPELLWREPDVNEFALGDVFVAAHDVASTAARWAEFAGLIPRPFGETVRLETERGTIVVGPPPTATNPSIPAPGIVGYSLACRHPKEMAARCSQHGLAVRRFGGRYTASLPTALGGYLVFG